jgi:hypothetical protein
MLSSPARHGLAAGMSTVVAAGVGVLTNLVTDRWQPSLLLAMLALVATGAGLEAWLTATTRYETKSTAAGAGAVAVGGSNKGAITTRVRVVPQSSPRSAKGPGRASASGPGAVAIGDDNSSRISTDISPGDPPKIVP